MNILFGYWDKPPRYSQTTATLDSQNKQWRPPEKLQILFGYFASNDLYILGSFILVPSIPRDTSVKDFEKILSQKRRINNLRNKSQLIMRPFIIHVYNKVGISVGHTLY